mgnify:CR=1 FL=1|jgi:hypothetical protein|nr:MAG TPA: hypothetical protein [Caudoviricetes sp.]
MRKIIEKKILPEYFKAVIHNKKNLKSARMRMNCR